MTTKRVIIDQIEITRMGHINIRFSKQIFEEGKNKEDVIISSENHRVVMEIGIDIDLQMLEVNKHLAKMNWPFVTIEEYQNVKKYADIKWTPELKQWWKIQREVTQLNQLVEKKGFSHVVF